MAKLVVITRKQLWEDWIISPPDYGVTPPFTQEEYDTIIVPYANYIRSLPGINFDAIDVRKNETTLSVIRLFDTLENAQHAEVELCSAPTNMAVLKMMKLMRDKQEAAGYRYTYECKVLP